MRLRLGTALTIAAVTLAGTLTGCASSPSEGDAATTPEGPIAITVARGQVNIENSILAQEQGFFEDAGLEATMEVSQGAAAMNSAIVSGEFDVGMTDAVSAVRAIAEGMPITVIAGTKSANPELDGDASDGLIVPPGSPITSWSDLAGKKIGVPDLGGLPQIATMKALTENGVDLNTVEFVALPLPALPEAAAKGQVDAVFVFSIFLLKAVDNGFTRVGTGVREYLPNSPQSLWITSTKLAEDNPEALKRFHKAITEGTEFGNKNPDAVRKVYHENTELPGDFIDNAMVLEPLSTTLDEAGVDLLVETMVAQKQLPKDLSFDEIVWADAR
jgi:NitT/TauT family transport system substrate-binding protein